MIVSAGYNIAGPEVEAALLSAVEVNECAVVGVADDERGQIVQAHMVLADGRGARRCYAVAAAEPRQGDNCALQVSALGGIRGRAAEDTDRKDPAVPVKIVRPAARPCVSWPRKLDE